MIPASFFLFPPWFFPPPPDVVNPYFPYSSSRHLVLGTFFPFPPLKFFSSFLTPLPPAVFKKNGTPFFFLLSFVRFSCLKKSFVLFRFFFLDVSSGRGVPGLLSDRPPSCRLGVQRHYFSVTTFLSDRQLHFFSGMTRRSVLLKY